MPVHDDGIVERFTDSHIMVIGLPVKMTTSIPPKKCVVKSCVMQILSEVDFFSIRKSVMSLGVTVEL